MQVKRVVMPPLEYASKTAVPGLETLEDYVEEASGAGREGVDGGAGEGGKGRMIPGADIFRDDVSYIYLLTK